MAQSEAHVMDVIQIHDETLFGNSRYNKVGLVEQVQNINQQVIILQNAPESYNQEQLDEMLLLKADRSELIDAYSKTEDDALLLLKANVVDIVDSYSKTETDTLLDDKADKTDTYSKTETDTLLDAKVNVVDIVDSYSKTETDALLDDKADKTDSYSKTETDTLLDAKANVVDIVDSYSKTDDDALLLLKANVVDIVDSYSKSEDDALLLLKADKTQLIDSYSMTEDDALLLLKADKSDTYTKTETDTLLDAKANVVDIVDSYSKIEDDALLLLKANIADLTNYVDLTSAQTITAQKQFGVISVSSISKQSKNDASILLAGGGDMLVSSLVTQPQLQEVRDIATRKSKAYVFSTQGELNDWMAIQDNVAKLVIGDNLYIVDKEVTDYWWDGTDLKALETELPDMSNVVTTLGTATGGGNAITDISIDGNVLTPAKNKNFVDTDYDQSINVQKTFNTTIHSVGIMVQTYSNSSVICAGGGVRSIADIQSASYSKSEGDTLLLLKADKTQLIDSYTKGETDNLLNNKANTGVSYTKGEDDALLLLKADKTQLIDSYTKQEDDALLLLKADKTQLIESYTKGETDNLLNNKANNGVSYNKSEDDTLLFAKADKTQLIQSYTKGDTDNLLNNKADNGISYSKSDDDTLLFAKADKKQLIDSYTKGEADNLLNSKANQTTTYIKLEIDYLISQIEVGEVDLSGYMTLSTSQTINANKTFNNACRFISSIDGMSTVTGSSFVKSGADDTVVLLGAYGTKPISEFAATPTDLSNYYIKAQTFSQTEANNKFVRFDGSIQQTITRRLKYVSPFDYQDETQDPVANTYLTMSEVDAKLTNVVTTNTTQSITGAKTFNANVSATGFAKTGKDDTSVLLAGGGDQLLSSFGGVQVEDITNLILNLHSNIQFNYLKLVRIGTFYTLMMEIIPKTQISISTSTTICSIGNSTTGISPPTPPSTSYPIQLATNRKTLTCVYSYRDFKISTDSTEVWGINDDVGLQFSWML
ncbi:MAG: hypothetical protein EZS28_008352 [Streblomastix strix]|uniref:Uncharacterized protein n=1 Tax=Streblomastix strix TaxID=222440 RepID=A0A5J4WML1_9EUKA|nr:MAG: hypothetical protein EZS28_008352 [Streblomastix strix]